MKFDILFRFCLLFTILFISWGFIGVGEAQENVPSPAEQQVRFFSEQVVLWAGRTQVIPLKISTPAKESMVFEFISAAPEKVEILMKPKILAGERIGYCRVRALEVGETSLKLVAKGSSEIELKVKVRKTNQNPESHLKKPSLFGIASGAFVWGKFSIGVEFFNDPIRSGKKSLPITLVLPNGNTLSPISEKQFNNGPFRFAYFEVDANTLSLGTNEFIALVEDETQTYQSAPISVVVIKPKTEEVLVKECENHLSGDRPKRFGEAHPRLGSSPEASNGGFVLNAGPNPAWSYPYEVKETGYYQVMTVARGDFAGGAYPTIGVYLDEAPRAITSGQLVHNRWHRVAIGHPFRLEAGKRFLTLYYLNDFYARALADRNLYLDRFELVRIDAKASSKKESSSSSMNMMAMNDNMMESKAPANGQQKTVRVAFNPPFHGKIVTGKTTVQGFCQWTNQGKEPPPLVTLVVNGSPLSSHQAGDPFFWLDRSALRKGTNEIQLRARLASGETAWTPVQEVLVEGEIEKRTPRSYYRFTAVDSHWDAQTHNRLRPQGRDKVSIFSTNGTGVLSLPEAFSGTFDLYLDGRGFNYQGWSRAKVSVKVGEQLQDMKTLDIRGWSTYKMGTFSFEKGPKEIHVAFVNDKHKEKKGDRNLWLRSIILESTATKTDQKAPKVNILYPGKGHKAFGADLVVASVYDNNEVNYGDIVVDGKIQRMNLRPRNGFGTVLFPLILRNLEPGMHRVLVRVWDRYGNLGESKEVEFEVLPKAPKAPLAYARAVHLLKRFAYGPELRELADVLTMGEEKWLNERLSRTSQDGGELAALEHGYQLYPNDQSAGHVIHRVLRHLLLTNNPVRYRFVLWTQNHFSTWMRKTQPWSKWEEHQRFLQLGVAPFSDMLLASATSPAMLLFLDQHRSFAYRLNENYAREIMELHSLGVDGGYSQKDVTTLAGLLNGWTFSDEADSIGTGYPLARHFRFDPGLNDGKDREIFGMEFEKASPEFRHDRVRLAIEMLASHPATARFICRKLINHYVAIPAKESMVEELTQRFLANGGDLKDLLIAISQHPEFWNSELPTRLTSPLDFTTSVLRICQNPSNGWVHECMANSGVTLFDRATPDGYPEENDAYASSNSLLQRWRFAKRAGSPIYAQVPGVWRTPPQLEYEAWKQKVVDYIAIRLTGFPLSEESNQSALEMIGVSKEEGWRKVLEVAQFICQLPEVNFR